MREHACVLNEYPDASARAACIAPLSERLLARPATGLTRLDLTPPWPPQGSCFPPSTVELGPRGARTTGGAWWGVATASGVKWGGPRAVFADPRCRTVRDGCKPLHAQATAASCLGTTAFGQRRKHRLRSARVYRWPPYLRTCAPEIDCNNNLGFSRTGTHRSRYRRYTVAGDPTLLLRRCMGVESGAVGARAGCSAVVRKTAED